MNQTAFERGGIRFQKEKDDEPKIVYAIADTHFGLRERRRSELAWRTIIFACGLLAYPSIHYLLFPKAPLNVLFFLFLIYIYLGFSQILKIPKRNRSEDSAFEVVKFLRWLEELKEKEPEELLVYEDGIKNKISLKPATHIVLLGDILELWDGEDNDVFMSSLPIWHFLDHMDATKVYVFGNHDSIMSTYDNRTLPFQSGMEVKSRYDIPIGNGRLRFIHGQQIQWGNNWTGKVGVISTMRNVSVSMGDWPLLFYIVFIALFTIFLNTDSYVSTLALVASIGFLALMIPRIVVFFARFIWWFIGLRHKSEKKIHKRLTSWWKEEDNTDDLIVVFGHTHDFDWIDGTKIIPKNASKRKRVDPSKWPKAAVNISSWIKWRRTDKALINKDDERGMQYPTVLYADGTGKVYLLGWDPWNNELFHIPIKCISQLHQEVNTFLKEGIPEEDFYHYWCKEHVEELVNSLT